MALLMDITSTNMQTAQSLAGGSDRVERIHIKRWPAKLDFKGGTLVAY